MKSCVSILCVLMLFSCTGNNTENTTKSADQAHADIPKQKERITAMLDSFNVAAANAEYDRYFQFFTADATYIGTDATENWTKQAYLTWAKPYFDKKKTWNFKALQRNIYFGSNPDIAWFDELLQTQMKICRGSGVVVRQGNEWKVQQYVLSMTVPNEHTDAVVKVKAAVEDSVMVGLGR
jgi:SnoaL-like domain